MMKKKIGGACLIFLMLFGGAWKLDHSNKRIFFQTIPQDQQVADVLPINNINTPLNELSYEIFKPREYVRIIRIIEETYHK